MYTGVVHEPMGAQALYLKSESERQDVLSSGLQSMVVDEDDSECDFPDVEEQLEDMEEVKVETLPFAEEQRKIISSLEPPLQCGDVWNLISAPWFEKWKRCVGYEGGKASGSVEELAPIDNSHLLAESGNTKLGLQEGVDFFVIHHSQWRKLQLW